MNKAHFGRNRDQLNLMLRNLVTSLIIYESITTTAPKGRAIQPIFDRLMRVAQGENKLTARRTLRAYLTTDAAVSKMLDELVTRFGDQQSGFTRRFRLPARLGDGAPQAIIQLTKTVLLDQTEAASKSEEAKVASGAKESDE